MFGLDQSPRYACRSTSPPPPAPLPRSGFVQRPKDARLLSVGPVGRLSAPNPDVHDQSRTD